MDLGDQRTGGIEDGETAALGLPFDGAGHAMRAEHREAAARHLGQAFDKTRAAGLQLLDHMAIVDYFVAHIDGRVIFFERALDDLDGPDHAGTKASRLGQDDLHSLPQLIARRGATTETKACFF